MGRVLGDRDLGATERGTLSMIQAAGTRACAIGMVWDEPIG